MMVPAKPFFGAAFGAIGAGTFRAALGAAWLLELADDLGATVMFFSAGALGATLGAIASAGAFSFGAGSAADSGTTASPNKTTVATAPMTVPTRRGGEFIA
ncbi:MAG: hypothetical protein JNL39_18115 [Opitutaceae bacterium]|nr:hypothetical protein [Opitutaceae bacterium]